ncbi:MAG TPA: PKD domain-containing protein [Bacteroidia bacterium]|nr:PKD domain-containing protein [Bacteroidia bacterium]
MKKVLLILFLSAFGPGAFAQCMMVPVSMTDKVSNASVIIEGKIVGSQSWWNSTHDFIYTGNTIEVYKLFKGSLSSAQIVLVTEGGTIGSTKITADPSPATGVGTTGIFFCIPAQQLPPLTTASGLPFFEAYASAQGVIQYNTGTFSATDPFNTYPGVVSHVYPAITAITGTGWSVVQSYNALPPQNLGPGNPTAQALPVITGITSPSTAGTFSLITVSGNNFGAGPFGGTRLLEFPDANNGGAGFIPTPANHIISWTNTSIQAWVPTGAGSGSVRVTNDLNETTTSGVTITINYNETNVNSGGVYYQPDLVNDNGTGGYTWAYNNTFNGNAPAVAAFERALQTWRCGTLVNFNRSGTTALSCQALDGSNIVTFDGSCALPAGVLGVSYSYYSGCGSGVWYVTENDLKFRTNGTGGINWNYGPAPTAGGLYDFESVCLHELGHSHQLGHTILPVTVMNYAVGPNTDRRTLTAASETAGGNDIRSRSTIANSCGPSPLIALTAGSCAINAPIADFAGSPLTGCNSLNVTFTDQSINAPTSWNWSFPGGVPAVFAGQNPPVINYASPGVYTVTLVVSNAFGSDTETKTGYITVLTCPPPTADFSGNPQTVCAGQQVQFLDASTNTPTSWSWTFTGGTPAVSASQNPLITYNVPGIYDVSLTATNPYGSGSVTKTGYIVVNSCPPPPVTDFSASPTSLCSGGTVSFTDLSTNAPNYWQWTFTGGTPATSLAQNPSVTYNTPGTYAVTLTASNGSGSNTITKVAYITVNLCSAPVAAFAGWPGVICAGQQVNFTDLSTNIPASWSWTFPGGAPAVSAAQNPVVSYAAPGTYNVTLQVTNAFGSNSITLTNYITVTNCPAAGSGLIVNDGSLIFIQPGGLITVEGGIINQDNGASIGNFDNSGLVTLTGDWTNNSSSPAYINASPGTHQLLGAAQLITGTTPTRFNNLTLSGTGIKTITLLTYVEGILALNDRELATQGNILHVTNTATGAITRTGGLNSTPVQGFVSSTGAGRLRRNTASTGTYLFPLGSSQGGAPRFRPVALKPGTNAPHTYSARFVNNDPTIDGYSVFLKDPTLGIINNLWYQKINRDSGNADTDVTLYFDATADGIAPLPSLLMTQWGVNAPVQWRAISAVLITGAGSPVLSSITKPAWNTFLTENFNLSPQSIPLPVELIDFRAECNKQQVVISWQTASEINSDYFMVEKSTDGQHFQLLQIVKGAGTTSMSSFYSVVDSAENGSGQMHYRLLQADYDGSVAALATIASNCHPSAANTGITGIFPNPFYNQVHLLANFDRSHVSRISVFDVTGRLVYVDSHTFPEGFSSHVIDLDFLAPAVYQLVIDDGYERHTTKIIKE